LRGQIAYWNAAGATKVFTHLPDHTRLTAVDGGHGFSDVIGVDVSAALTEPCGSTAGCASRC
jgi:hypothetical protein